MKKFATLLVGAALMTGANATPYFGGTFTNPLQTTEIAQSGTLQFFDSSLGTLNSISLILNGQLSTTLSLENTSTGPQLVEATTNSRLFFDSPFNVLDALIASPATTLSATTGVVLLAANSTTNFGPLTDNENYLLNSSAAGLLSALSQVGGGNFTMSCFSISGFSVDGGGGNIQTDQSTQAACGATLNYDYTATPTTVPEPGALALVGLALAGLSLSRRFSKKA